MDGGVKQLDGGVRDLSKICHQTGDSIWQPLPSRSALSQKYQQFQNLNHHLIQRSQIWKGSKISMQNDWPEKYFCN